MNSSARSFPSPATGSAISWRKINSWSRQRELLRAQGWGFVPLFNGPTSRSATNPLISQALAADAQSLLPLHVKKDFLRHGNFSGY